MKKLLTISTLILIISTFSCTENKPYYQQFNNDKAFTTRILDLNKTYDEIKKEEKGKLVKEDLRYLEFVYNIGQSDTYVISYLFDEKGCYEIGIDGYFELESDAENVVKGIQTEMSKSKYGNGTNDNSLNQWKNEDKSISVDLDYKDTSRGMFIATIFANE